MAEVLLQDVSVEYPVPDVRSGRSLRGALARGPRLRPGARVRALSHVSLYLKEGDRLGLIGRNGAGKTTLLKTIAGIVPPARGRVQISGDLLTLFNPQAALDLTRTGWENIEVVGLLMGLDKTARRALAEDVADFSELGAFLDVPIDSYSAGMVLRLAFGIATGVPRDILLIDEVIGAGDAGFQKKAQARIEALCDGGKIVVVATHDYQVLSRLCDQAAFLQRGGIAAQGPIPEVWEHYLDSFLDDGAQDADDRAERALETQP